MYKGCIFDLDGTLLNTLDTIAYYGNTTLKKFFLPPINTEDYKYLVGDGARVLIRRMLTKNGISDEILAEHAYKYYADIYDSNPYLYTSIYNGIDDLLMSLRRKNLTLCVLSNKPHSAATAVVRRFFGDNIFQYVFGARDSIPKKPDPAMANFLIRKMDIEAHQCLYIGDTDTDMKTGRAAGLYTIGALWGFRTKDELVRTGADFVALNPLDILSCL